jgi:DNA-nicking Smr family endonuclease
MSRDGGKPGQSGKAASRQITPDEAELWHRLTQSVDKVKVKPRVAGHDAPGGPAPRQVPAAQKRHAPRRAAAPASVPLPVPAPARAHAQLDRRALRKVAGGKVAIDDVLDLHGLTQATAHARLRAFLRGCQAEGCRTVLVITGKGGGRQEAAAPDAEARGVLRRNVPHWLEAPDLQGIVLGYSAAGVKHGGEGALYIRLRKAREA